MKEYCALVKVVGDEVEEEVTLVVGGTEVTSFAGVCPYEIEVGRTYPVSFELMIFNEYEVEKSGQEIVGFERIGDSFSYWVSGRLTNGVLDCGIEFEDEVLLSEYGYLDDSYIRLRVDRIDVEFLERQRC